MKKKWCEATNSSCLSVLAITPHHIDAGDPLFSKYPKTGKSLRYISVEGKAFLPTNIVLIYAQVTFTSQVEGMSRESRKIVPFFREGLTWRFLLVKTRSLNSNYVQRSSRHGVHRHPNNMFSTTFAKHITSTYRHFMFNIMY